MKKIVFGSFSLLALTIVLFTSQASCTKETIKETTKTDTVYKCTPTIQGLWTGASQSAPAPAINWSWSIRPDGTASYENTLNGTRQLSVGTWQLTNGTWTATVTGIYGTSGHVGTVQTFTATYNATTGTLTNGTFGTNSTFTLTEVN